MGLPQQPDKVVSMEETATVCRISIAPVKGMRVQSLDEAALTPHGIPGDRAFFLIDSKRRMVNSKRFGGLISIIPEHDRTAGTLSLRFPDGGGCAGPLEFGDRQAVTFFGLQVQARPVLGAFSKAVSGFLGEDLRLMERPENRPAVDRGAVAGVTLLGTASVERLEQSGREFERERDPADRLPDSGPIDHRRFRMSIEFDGTGPHEEDGWVGHELTVGEAVVLVGGHVGRCAVTTRDPESGVVDLRTLHYLKAYRGRIPSEEPLPFGVYGQIRQPGNVRVGDRIIPK